MGIQQEKLDVTRGVNAPYNDGQVDTIIMRYSVLPIQKVIVPDYPPLYCPPPLPGPGLTTLNIGNSASGIATNST